jgi:hypothetical protein
MSEGLRRALLGRLIDHAPLFPPASLPVADALAEDRRARASAESWMLGRFVCPASKVAELGDEVRALSVVLDDGLPKNDPRIEAIEVSPGGRNVLVPAGSPLEVYVEVPADWELLPKRAKVRCGGAAVPAVEELGGFVRRCREARVPFKATAGLHHAVRTDSEHGFLNLLAAAVFGDEEEALAERDAGAFAIGDSFRWRDRTADAGEVARVRRELFVSFGSCSFFEPVDDLRALGLG